MNSYRWFPLALLVVLVLIGCAEETPQANTGEFLPPADLAGGWKIAEGAELYSPETLFDYMDGEAELFFTYGFQELAVGRYIAAEGEEIRVEVYRLAEPDDAYGLYTFYRQGEEVKVGIEGSLIPGRWVTFWQNRYYVRVSADRTTDDQVLLGLARAISEKLPTEGQRPSLVEALPQEGLVPESVKFFHEKLAMDNIVWMGPENVLHLSASTDGVAATYQLGNQKAKLVLVRYPDAAQAEAALSDLKGANIEGLTAFQQQGEHLVVILHAPDARSAQRLIKQVVEKLQGFKGRQVIEICSR